MVEMQRGLDLLDSAAELKDQAILDFEALNDENFCNATEYPEYLEALMRAAKLKRTLHEERRKILKRHEMELLILLLLQIVRYLHDFG